MLHVLSANTATRDHEFRPDELPFADAVAFAKARLLGQQATDAWPGYSACPVGPGRTARASSRCSGISTRFRDAS